MNNDKERAVNSTTDDKMEPISERELRTTNLGDAAAETKGGILGTPLDGGGGYVYHVDL